jgi:hypothetical protein
MNKQLIPLLAIILGVISIPAASFFSRWLYPKIFSKQSDRFLLEIKNRAKFGTRSVTVAQILMVVSTVFFYQLHRKFDWDVSFFIFMIFFMAALRSMFREIIVAASTELEIREREKMTERGHR